MPHPDVEARASELLRVLQVPEAQAEYLRPRVTDLLNQVRADALACAARLIAPGPIERRSTPQPTVIELEGLAATLDAGARVTRQGKAWPSK